MSEWRETTLGEVAVVSPKEPPLAEDAPFVTMADVSEWGTWAQHNSQRGARGGVRARAGDVLMARITPCLENGKIAVVPKHLERVGGSTEFIVIRETEQVLSGFLFLWAVSPVTHTAAVGLMTGSTGRQRVAAGDVAALPLALPTLDEQRRIVDVVVAVDAQIEALQAEVAVARQATTRTRSHLFADLDCMTIPAGEMFDMLLGRQKSDRQAVGDHVLPYLRSGNVTAGALALSDVMTMNFEPHEQIKYGLSPGDIMLTEGGTPGQAARWNGEIDGVVGFDKHVIRLRARPGISLSEFALQWCHWSQETGAFDAQATGITIKALGFGRACAMPVPALSIEDQAVLVAPLAALDGQMATLVVELANLRAFRSTLLTALLSQSIAIPESYETLLDADPSALEGAPA